MDGKLPTRLISTAGGADDDVLTKTPSGPQWRPAGGSGLVIVDDTEPTSPPTGQLWFDTAATGTLLFSDDFNRADSTTSAGPGWSTAFYNSAGTPAWGVDTNRAYVVDPGTGAVLYRDIGAADGVLEADIPVLPSGTGDDSGVVFRFSSPGNLWFISGQRISLYYGGSPISVGVTSSYLAAGDHIKVVLNGPSIVVYRNGTEWQNVTDTHLMTATKHGLIGDTNWGPNVRYDNFSFTALPKPFKIYDGTSWITIA